MESNNYLNIFEEEYLRIAGDREFIILHDVIKLNYADLESEHNVNLAHIRIMLKYINY